MAKPFEDFCEDKAREGDGAFAVAFAILRLNREIGRSAKALEQLGIGDAISEMGAVEGLGIKIVEAAEIISARIQD